MVRAKRMTVTRVRMRRMTAFITIVVLALTSEVATRTECSLLKTNEYNTQLDHKQSEGGNVANTTPNSMTSKVKAATTEVGVMTRLAGTK